jgi:uncharacterized protein YbjT (DUF2867 family)
MIVITGATGNTGKAAVEVLLAKGETNNEKIRAIGRDQSKLQPFATRGADAFVGHSDDAESMAAAFKDADAVYLMIPPALHVANNLAYQDRVSDAYATAVKAAHVKYVVTLSSLGAQHPQGTGPIVGVHNLEQKINAIPGLNVLHLHPAAFMENLLSSIQPLRSMGTLPGPAPADRPGPYIAARDIGVYAAGRLAARDFSGSSVQELLGPRDYTMREAASTLGQAIGKPNLGYMQVPLPMLEGALVQMGFPKPSAMLMIEMFKAQNAGLCDPHEPRSPKNATPTTLESFAAEIFAPAYLGKTASA